MASPKLIILALAVMEILVATTTGCRTEGSLGPLKVWFRTSPYSADPIEYDAFVHHVTFRPVLTPLVSRQKAGQYLGVVAESWNTTTGFRDWTFHLRPGLTFNDGSPINAQAVARSLTRLAFCMKTKNSGATPLSTLVGYAKLQSASDALEGIRAENPAQLVLRFDRPQPKLLDDISFGIYSIVSSNDFDPISGKWKDPRKVTPSGPYSVRTWTDKVFELSLRPEFPKPLRHPEAAETIRIENAPEARADADLIVEDSMSGLEGKGFGFHGGVLSSIAYIHCISWSEPGSPCADITLRRRLRDAFYEEMQKADFKITRSFFPTVMPGVRQMPLSVSEKQEQGFPHPDVRPLRFRLTTRDVEICRRYVESVLRVATRFGLKSESKKLSFLETGEELEPGKIPHAIDLDYIETGILVDDPDGDIHFMFESKEGIRLPDLDGRIREELKKSPLNVQRINELLWDQAVIWPLTHFAHGLWTKPGVDVSLLNMTLPPTDLSLIGWKGGR